MFKAFNSEVRNLDFDYTTGKMILASSGEYLNLY